MTATAGRLSVDSRAACAVQLIMAPLPPGIICVQGACGVCCKLLLALIASYPADDRFGRRGPFAGSRAPPRRLARLNRPARALRPAAFARGAGQRDGGVIVALGSSSTDGVMASDPAHSYPAELQAALSDALPRSHIAVHQPRHRRTGRAGGTGAARRGCDRPAPALVIWQVGANGALRNADPADSVVMVTAGGAAAAGCRCRRDPDGQPALAANSGVRRACSDGREPCRGGAGPAPTCFPAAS